jgi:dihydrophenazinedicarboxylate synthase
MTTRTEAPVGAGKSETLTQSVEVGFPEFTSPPPDPIAVLGAWFDRAIALGVREPRALALATADRDGRPSTRMVAVNEVSAAGLVFSTHANSRKGRELTENPWFSGVLYWRETSQQVVIGGRARRLPDEKADALWFGRPWETHAMSVAARQSTTLHDVAALRAEAQRLADIGGPLPRPEGYSAYELRAESLEFWANGTERMHERLLYELGPDGWTARRLQP